jgi:hypothetical protein
VFGAITALAALLIAAQVIARQLRFGADELTTLRALGADRAMTTSDGLVGLLGAVVIGSLLAVAVAVGLSPLAPLGPVRPVDPHPGLAFDWTVLGLGLVVLVAGLSAIAVALAYREAPRRVARRQRGAPGSSLARLAANSDLPAPAVAGIRFALDPGGGKTAAPVRSAILGATLAVIVVITAATFGASLTTLVSHPRLYGWNWDYELVSAGGEALGDIPEHQAAALLDADPQVAGWAGVYFSALTLNGQSVPVMGTRPGTDVQPPILSGHRLEAPGQVVLGATTLAELHERVGDTVLVSNGSATPSRLRIVGTATMPAIGLPAVPHLEPGTGALLDDTLIPPKSRNVFANPLPGPNAILVRFKSGANAATFDSVQQTVRVLEGSGGQGSIAIDPVQRPAEIVDYRSIGDTPALLGLALGAGAVVALGLTLIASVRRRRRELALFKTLGFTGGQLAATVAWQSSIAVGLGAVLGVPLGIVLGRLLWVLFAHEINVVPAPSVPVTSVVLIALGALALANLVAAVPGWMAARTPTAPLLRAE